ILTYKGPRQHGQLKSRDETEVNVGNPDEAAEFLQRLGYTRVLSFQKRRESWKLEGCKIELDELPYLGVFIEIEGPKEAAVLKVREMIGLADRPIVKASYIALLMTHLQERGDTNRDVSFLDGGGTSNRL